MSMAESFEFDCSDYLSGGRIDPDRESYSIVQLSKEHRQRFYLQTSAGAVILRYMPLRCARAIDTARRHICPRLEEYRKRLQALYPLIDGIPEEQYDESQKEVAREIMDLFHTIQITDYSPLGVIEAPALYTLEDYEDLLSQMTEEERAVLSMAVTGLARIRPETEVDETAEVIAERLGIKLFEGDFIEDMTVSQARYWTSRITKEGKAMADARR